MEIDNIYIYRITHIENIPHVLQYGITHKSSPFKNTNFTSIGDSSLINFRDTKEIDVHGTNVVLGECIPFYFGIRMPMLYVIQHGYNYTTATPAENIVYIAVSLNKIVNDDNITFYYTDGHATDIITNFYNKDNIKELPSILDWNAIKNPRWSGDGIETDLKRRKQAEFLSANDIPPEYIHGFLCYNEVAKQQLTQYGVDEAKIKIYPQAYY